MTTFGMVAVRTIESARDELAGLLAPTTGDDPDVLSAPVDALVPPALILGWRGPMLDDYAACTAFANLFVMIVAQRLDLATGYEVLEAQYQRVQTTLRANGWVIVGDSGPGAAEIGKTLYLAVRLDARCPVSL